MRNKFKFRRLFLMISLFSALSFGLISCKQEAKDTEEMAEDQNEQKFETDDAKEDAAEFLVDAAALDHEEIQLGKRAQLSANAEIKAHGKMMEDAHTTSFNELKMLAEQKQITVPMSVTEDGMESYNKLNDKKAENFDKDYLDMMVNRHEEGVRKFERFIEKSNDAEITAWATKTLETLRMHLTHSKELRDRIKK